LHHKVRRAKLESELADIEQESSRLKAGQSISAGLRVARETWSKHLRQKKLLEIELHDLKGRIAKLEAEYEYSKTPGAQKVWHDREMQRLAGSAIGGGSYFRQGGTRDSGPEVEALRKLTEAQADYNSKKARLDELCKSDPDFENLVAEKEQEEAGTTPAALAELEAEGVRLNSLNRPTGKQTKLDPTDPARGTNASQSNLSCEKAPQPSKKRVKHLNLANYLDAAGLTTRQHDCASLRWEYDVPVSQIARELGITRKTVDQHLAFAESKLKSSKAGEHLRRRLAKGKPEE
jgi:hypothetical protein